MPVNSVLTTARNEVGATEYPPGSNKTKYGAAYGWDGVPWCVMFLWWCFREGGESAAFYGGNKTASCSYLLEYYQARNQLCQPQHGAIAFYNFQGTKTPEHCGIIIGNADNGLYWSIEGNTSTGDGSQDNGGCVALKLRSPDSMVACAMPKYSSDYAGHWAKPAIEWAVRTGIMVGYPDGTFLPDMPVTRAELATALERMAKYGNGE